jgi:hypothetical protein
MRKKVFCALVPLGSLIFSLLALEVCLRAYTGEWAYINFRRGSDSSVIFDAELGWIPKQYARGPWGTMDDGIRPNGGEEIRDTTDPILAVGDSFTFGSGVSDSETWPAQLENLLGTRTFNAGVSGYGIDQAFLRVRRLLSRYKFHTVIFSFIPDDIRRCQMSAMWGEPKPYFDFKNGRLTLENVPIPPPLRPSATESALLIALEHSRLAHFAMNRLFPEWWVERAVEVHNEEEGTEVACSLLHELETLTRSDSNLIILVEYERGDIFSESVAIKIGKVLSCLTDSATRIIDLKAPLLELNTKDPSWYNRLYLPHNRHMSAAGNKFVALEISKFLNANVN